MHTAIVGKTRTGKTTLARALVKQLATLNRHAIILDPISSTDWGHKAIQVDSIERLIELAKQHHSRVLVVDETALSMDRFDPTQNWVSKTSRHCGHASIYIGQEYVDIPKGTRTQCEQIFVFRCARDEAKEFANEYDNDKLLDATKLEKFHFFRMLDRKVQRGRVDPSTLKIFLEKA